MCSLIVYRNTIYFRMFILCLVTLLVLAGFLVALSWNADPLRKAGERTHILKNTNQIHFCCAMKGTPLGIFYVFSIIPSTNRDSFLSFFLLFFFCSSGPHVDI